MLVSICLCILASLSVPFFGTKMKKNKQRKKKKKKKKMHKIRYGLCCLTLWYLIVIWTTSPLNATEVLMVKPFLYVKIKIWINIINA